MNLDHRPVYMPPNYRPRMFPLKTKIALAVGFVLLVAFGGQMIRGYFEAMQWVGDGIAARLR